MNEQANKALDRAQEIEQKLAEKFKKFGLTSKSEFTMPMYSSQSHDDSKEEYKAKLTALTEGTSLANSDLSDLQSLKDLIIANSERRLAELSNIADKTAPTIKKVQASELKVSCIADNPLAYSLFHIGVPTINELTITNMGVEHSQNLLVEICLSPPEFGGTWTENIPKLLIGEKWKRKDIKLPLNTERFRNIVENEPIKLCYTVKDKEETLFAATQETKAMAYNEWFALPISLATFVQSNDPSISSVIECARVHLEELTQSRAFSGYQSKDPAYIQAMMVAVHTALVEDYKFGYINPPPSFEKTGQKIRLVADTLTQKQGTCLDLAVLQVAILEHIGLNPCIVSIPGHAMLACWMHEICLSSPVMKFNQKDSKTMQQLIKNISTYELCILNSTEVAHNQTLSDAQEHGMQFLLHTLKSGGRCDIHRHTCLSSA